MFELKKTSRDIIIGVVITLLSAAIIGHFSGIFGGASSPDKETIKQESLKTLQAYCNDLNNPDHEQFDAYKYFSPHVDKFITMNNTTPKDINTYIHGKFRKDFVNYSTSMDEGTFLVTAVADEYYEVSVIMYADYFSTIKKKQFTKYRAKTDIRLDKNYRIKYFRLLYD